MHYSEAKKIMKINFIGPGELKVINKRLHITDPTKKEIPRVPYTATSLKKLHKDYILILGMPKDHVGKPLTINRMRKVYGVNPQKKEPCMYNQDWYLKEKFASKAHLDFYWYLIRKSVVKETRGKQPDDIEKKLSPKEHFPSAILTAFTFFAYYFHTNGKILWGHDFIWCSDTDHNGDRIYTGRYEDIKGINKNGFNIHRHLSIRSVYGAASQYI